LRAPFATVAIVSFTGVPPIQAVRLLVLTTGYSTTRYASALALGRLPRFFVIALAGRALALPGSIMLVLTVVFLAWPAALFVRHLVRRERAVQP
jgi:ribonucleoside-triphosphate reductase